MHLAVGLRDFMMGLALVSCGVVIWVYHLSPFVLLHVHLAGRPHPPFVHLE
jgi:hypothetical protein